MDDKQSIVVESRQKSVSNDELPGSARLAPSSANFDLPRVYE